MNKEFAASVEADYPILSDPQKDVARAYGVVTPERERAFRWTFYVDTDGRILHIDREVNPNTAGPDMVARLEELGVARR